MIALISPAFAWAQHGALNGQWPYYAGDAASTKYAPLDQIDRDNVSKLGIAWTWVVPDPAILEQNRLLWYGSFEATPLMIDGVLYLPTSLNVVAALDAATGEERWTFDPKSYIEGKPPNKGFIHRGVAYWRNGEDERIFIGTADAYLYALDAKTGRPVETFGENGRVDLTKDHRRPVSRKGEMGVNSPPVVCRGVVVVGSTINDGPTRKEGTPGDVQGFDARTGKRLWVFHTVPQAGEFGNETWENDSWKYTGSANVWAPMSADEELGYVYLPVGTPTNDWYGGHRLGDNLFADSIVCLDAKTGERVWHFQTVHHGLWDYDVPCAPNLVDIVANDRPIRAVAQLTKTGFTFVFDRCTGEPVWPIEERPVPQSTVPGERTSPTQPFPTRPATFANQGMSKERLINLTPAIHEEAVKILEQYDYGELFTPPSERGAINLPGWGGGANWGGGAFDPETGILYVPSMEYPIRVKLQRPDPMRSNFDFVQGGGMSIEGPMKLPLLRPPWGKITAINLNTGEHVWQKPHGRFKRGSDAARAFGDGKFIGMFGISACVATKTLLFATVGRPSGMPPLAEPEIIVYDKATGEIVHAIPLPKCPTGAPMTYMANGKQFLVVATGGDREQPATLVALSLTE